MKRGLLLFLLPVVTGCATGYCERNEQVYETATERAPLQSPDGLQVPASDPNFAIPEATGEDVKYSTPVTDSKGRARATCLDAPPGLPAAAPPPEREPAAESESVPAAPAEPEADEATVETPEPAPVQL
jgi:hypothetical protein